ncbi:hypothetical protein ACJX0J_021688, partial [Zea mays]
MTFNHGIWAKRGGYDIKWARAHRERETNRLFKSPNISSLLLHFLHIEAYETASLLLHVLFLYVTLAKITAHELL